MNATSPPRTPLPPAAPLPYSRLILNVAGFGVCGWMLLDPRGLTAVFI